MATMNTGLGGPAGYGEGVFSTSTKVAGGNDDGSVQIDTTSAFGAGGINFFGTSYTSIYLNSNGTITFGSPDTSYETSDFTAETSPMIAAYFADVNIGAGGEIYYDVDPVAGTITLTWDGVAPYSGSGTNSFQVVLTSTGGGDFTVDFIYEDINWTDGGGQPAAVGITDGGANDIVFEGSADPAVLATYDSNDFDAGDPLGSYSVDFSGGVPLALNGIVEGTDGADVIDGSYAGDPEGDVVDGGDNTGTAGNEDLIHGYGGDDTISAGDEDDTVFGGAGNDTIDGGDGDDTIHGDFGAAVTSTSETLDWSAAGTDEQDLSAGFTQDTGTMRVNVSLTDDGNNSPAFSVESSDTVFVGTGETFDPNSSAYLFGNGDGATATVDIDFAGLPGSGMTDEVENVSFRINDVDWAFGNHQDIVTINAYDADGNLVTVTITPEGADTVSGNTVTAATTGESQADAEGSILVDIAGPVASIEIIYSNGSTGTQAVFVSDVEFDTIPDVGGNDIIDGGDGDDTIYGEDGDDTLTGGLGVDGLYGGDGDDTLHIGAGDTASGGFGSDSLYLDPTGALDGSGGTITIDGGEDGDDSDIDTLYLNGLVNDWSDVTLDGGNPENGTAVLSDGTTVTFTNIESIIICFTRGTGILTPYGERAIETLRPGDLVLTRDNGPQPIRWINKSSVPGVGDLAPVRIGAGSFGNSRDLVVSPQHRMVYQGSDAVLMFDSSEVMVPAKHLVNGTTITQTARDTVTYYHMLFDTHEVVFANGAATESFHPGHQGLDALNGAARDELFALFPELRCDPRTYGDTARPVLRGFEAKLLNVA